MPTKKKTSTTRRKPVAKENAIIVQDNIVPAEREEKTPTNLATYPLEEVLKWREAARKRIVKNQAQLDKLFEKHEAIARQGRKLDKKLHSDLTWCKKLNRVIARKVF